ncbi:DUF3310 domain-containing protein [Conchiformibius steedae]|uniref:DUF3310 domain-containing protein n=1 Tax=Conchiformibius steedae TaxID=153493 RepID=UPI0026EB4A17|nr:DUF3310 domain-containing protein [Conchiformibius steedae]
MENINHPKHYNQQPIECITVTSQLNFNLGNAVKYLWRYSDKNGKEDLLKAKWYLNRQHNHNDPMPQISVQKESSLLNDLCDCSFNANQHDAISAIVQAAANWHDAPVISSEFLSAANHALIRLLNGEE